MRRGSIASLLGIAVVAGGIATAVAVFLPWLPTPASREAGRIDFVFWFVIAICIFIFAVVVAVMVYSIVKFRAAPDDLEDGPPIHGHTGLEIGWTIVPAVLVIAIGIVSAIVLSRNDALGKNVLRINVTAQQFAWTFSYPDANGFTTGTLTVPDGRSVLLTFTSLDVIHSFWVAQWGQKQDTVPGLHPTLHITPDRIGTYAVICTELCGLGHALMRTDAIVVTPAAFASWLKKNRVAAAPPTSSSSPSVSGAAVFTNNGCGACHTLAASHSTGKIGPDLDKLKAWAAQAKQPLAAFVKESIVSPEAYIQPGFPKNVMPPTFGTSLSKPQLDALVQYLISSSKG